MYSSTRRIPSQRGKKRQDTSRTGSSVARVHPPSSVVGPRILPPVHSTHFQSSDSRFRTSPNVAAPSFHPNIKTVFVKPCPTFPAVFLVLFSIPQSGIVIGPSLVRTLLLGGCWSSCLPFSCFFLHTLSACNSVFLPSATTNCPIISVKVSFSTCSHETVFVRIQILNTPAPRPARFRGSEALETGDHPILVIPLVERRIRKKPSTSSELNQYDVHIGSLSMHLIIDCVVETRA